MRQMNREIVSFLLEGLKASLLGTVVEQKPDSVSWRDVFLLARKNNIEGLCWYGLKDMIDDEDLLRKWTSAKDGCVFRQMHFDVERETIMSELAKAGLSCLPLKGALIQTYYPELGMRFMSDNDLLCGHVIEHDQQRFVDPNEKESTGKKISEIMKSLGYSSIKVEWNCENFEKKPFLIFEMHQHLMPFNSEHYAYFNEVWNRAVRKENSLEYVMRDEDEYLFMIAHNYKHYVSVAGFGIRALCDEYVFLKTKGSTMDWEYIEEQCKILNILEFEKEIRDLSNSVFTEKTTLTDEQWQRIDYMVSNGTFGNLNTKILNEISKVNGSKSSEVRRKYMLQRLFPSKEWIAQNHPYFDDKPYLLPLLPVYRLAKGIWTHPDRLILEIKMIFGRKNNE